MLLKKSPLCVCDSRERGELRPVRPEGGWTGRAAGRNRGPPFPPPCRVRSCPLAGGVGSLKRGGPALCRRHGQPAWGFGQYQTAKKLLRGLKCSTLGQGRDNQAGERREALQSPVLSPGGAVAAPGTPLRPGGAQESGPSGAPGSAVLWRPLHPPMGNPPEAHPWVCGASPPWQALLWGSVTSAPQHKPGGRAGRLLPVPLGACSAARDRRRTAARPR